MAANVTQMRPAPLACTECRARHLKCDGGSPRCRRCTTDGSPCTYEPSRRGYGRRRIHGQRTEGPRQKITSQPDSNSRPLSSPSVDYTQMLATPDSSIANGHRSALSLSTNGTTSSSALPDTLTLTPESLDLPIVNRDLLIKSYYTHFHPAHPLLVPRQYFARQQYPEYLQWMVCFVGQHYNGQNSDNQDIESTVKVLLVPDKDEVSVPRVQALVLYTIVLHSLHRPHEALDCLRRANHLTHSPAPGQLPFVPSNPVGYSVEEESVRRTWWELDTVQTYLAALHRQPKLIDNTEDYAPVLPSSEESYNAGNCDAHPPSLASFENRVFAQDPSLRPFGTYCYRIEAIQLVRRVLGLFEDENISPNKFQAVDIAIASWKYYLPRDALVYDLGGSEQLLFQAHFFVHTASILLHFPRSDLPPTVPSAAEIACVKGHTQDAPRSSQHTSKVVAASKEIANLAANLTSTDSCSPFFICALILACVVQMAAGTMCRNPRDSTDIVQHRDRVVLLLGVLGELGQRWPVARNALLPLKLIAETVFAEPREHEETPASSYVPTEDGIDNLKDIAGLPWFDLFSVDDLMADFLESGAT